MEQRSQQHESSPDVLRAGDPDFPAIAPTPRACRWDRAADAPAPPPVWTRYIESRLRQFGEGR